MLIRDTIKEIRKSKKLTQTEFGKQIGVSRSYVAQLEAGKTEPSKQLLQKISDVFKISSEYFETKNVHLNEHKNIHLKSVLFKTGDVVTPDFVVQELRDKRMKINKLYQKLIDIKLMANKLKSKPIEDGLTEFIDQFADINNQYHSDYMFTVNNMKLYKEIEPVNLHLLSENSLNEYLQKLYTNLDLFETVFFDSFKRFYNEYMKDWYNANNTK